jgi:pimeloyl-ACP methyl ester carboxylesterase
MILAHLTVVAASILASPDILSGSEIKVQPARAHAPLRRSLAALDRPSERTIETLRRYDRERLYRKDVAGALASLERLARESPDPEVVYALAEIAWVEGRRLERWRKGAAVDRFVDTIAYVNDLMFEPALAARLEPTDPRFRLSLDLYNDSLDRLLRVAQAGGKPIMPGGTITLKTRGQELPVRVALGPSPWPAAEIDQVIPASDLEVIGLSSRTYSQYGLGVPMIGVHRPDDTGKGEGRFYPPEMAFPLTAVLRPPSRLRAPEAGAHAPAGLTLELYDPITTRRLGMQPSALMLEADLTTPLAFMWSRTDLDRYRWHGLFRPGQAMGRANLMLLRPYEPGKVPVVMVHGLVSSPLAWIPMVNELLRDPKVAETYQFMLYMYPTGLPIPIAMAGLRESLGRAKQLHDPDGRDPAFGRMILLGHSMGGLLSHAMVVDSGDAFWQLHSDRRFDQITGPREVLSDLERYLFFKPLPFVKRVVFLATPHRGSDLSRNMIGRLSAGLISEPDSISRMLSTLLKENPEAFDRRLFRRLPTSVETLDTNSELLLALESMRPAPDVAFHSIIGSLRPGPVASSTDGVVAYRSSHFDGAESELRVRSDHGVQKSPDAIREVRRILLRHVGLEPPRLTANPADALRGTATPTAPSRR